MANITELAQINSGAVRNQDLTTNSLFTLSVFVGGSVSPTELTKTVLDGLIAQLTAGYVTSVNGAQGDVGIPTAPNAAPGLLTTTDWNTFNAKQSALTFGNVSTSTTGVTVGNGSSSTVGPNVTVDVQTASGSQPGLLSSTDWNTFNGKQSALTPGSFSESTSSVLTITNGTTSTVGPNVTIQVKQASGSVSGYLSSTDWNTFNGKQAAGNYITALSSDVVASGPGSAAATIQSGVVTLAKMANLAANSIIGNNTASPATPLALTQAQVTAFLNQFSSTLQGVVPASGGGTTNFLRADGNWAVAGTGTVTAVTASSPLSSSGGTTPNITLSGQVAVANGGTAASNAASALYNLGAETVFNGITTPSQWLLSYVASTRTLSVVVAANDSFSVGGVYYSVAAGTQTITHAATNGMWYVYYNAAGVLTITQTLWDLLNTAPVATIYYNSSNAGGGAAGIVGYELHPGVLGMGSATHKNLHTTRGTQLLSGVVASGYTLNASGLANTSYALSAGSIADEDIVYSTAAQAQGGGNTYRIFYQTGTSAAPVWNWVDTASGGIYTNGTNAYYNQLTGGSWQLTADTTAGNTYINYWILATTANSAPQVVMIMGTSTYTTLATAQAATFASEVPNIGLLTAEGVVLYQATYRHNAFGAPGNCQLAGMTRVSTSIVTVGSGSGSVTSVGLADDTGIFNITGSPVTNSGTLVLSGLQNQTNNTVLAGPSTGGAGTPGFRALVSADLPTVGIAQGGTGQTTAGAALAALAGSVYDAVITVVASGGTPPGAVNGPISTGTAVTLPGSATFLGSELKVMLNGQMLIYSATGAYDYAPVGSSPYSQVSFSDNLQVGDVLHVWKDRNS